MAAVPVPSVSKTPVLTIWPVEPSILPPLLLTLKLPIFASFAPSFNTRALPSAEGQDCGRSGVAIFHKGRSFFHRKRYCERGAITEFCRVDAENRGRRQRC